jgi:hypothetical protein
MRFVKSYLIFSFDANDMLMGTLYDAGECKNRNSMVVFGNKRGPNDVKTGEGNCRTGLQVGIKRKV